VVHPSDMRLPNEAYGKALPVMLLRAAATATQKRGRQAGVGAPAYLLLRSSSVGSGGRTTRRRCAKAGSTDRIGGIGKKEPP
jgi:hypothetical protein